jgi:toxin ParE1/3/4
MTEYKIRQQALDDMENIWLYSLQQWGQEQADRYLRNILVRIEWLAANPGLGRHRIDIAEGYYCFPEGKHHIFYIIDGQIEVIAIPHQQMDVISYFE